MGLFQEFARITQKAHCARASTEIQENEQRLIEF